MASKRIDELTTRAVVNTDLLPPTPSGGPSGSATVAAVVAAGLSQPNSASSGAGASVTIKAADGVTSGAGGSISLKPGVQASTGGNGKIYFNIPGSDTAKYFFDTSGGDWGFGFTGISPHPRFIMSNFVNLYFSNIMLWGYQASGGSHFATYPASQTIGSNQNNLAISDSGYQRINCTTASNITGFSGELSNGRWTRLINVGTANLTIKHNDANSSAANRVYTSTGADIVLAPNQWAEFIYDPTNNGSGAAGWRATNLSVGSSVVSYISNTATVAANQNDYVLTGSAFQRINCTSASDITGIAPPTGGSHVDGRMIKVFNVGTANLTFKHNSTSSTAANRMYAASGADIVLGANDYIECVYDSTDNGSGAAGWRIA